MKALTTVLAVLFSVFLMPIYFVVYVLIAAVDLIIKIIMIPIRVIRSTYRSTVSTYRPIWYRMYARLGNPVCEICGEAKKKGRPVTINKKEKRWTHDDCDCAEKIARNIAKGNVMLAAMHIAAHRIKKEPISDDLLIRELRKTPTYQGVDEADLKYRVARVSEMANLIDPRMLALNFALH